MVGTVPSSVALCGQCCSKLALIEGARWQVWQHQVNNLSLHNLATLYL